LAVKTLLSTHAASVLFRLLQVVWALILGASALLLAGAIPARYAQMNRIEPHLDIFSGALGQVEADLLSQAGVSLPFCAGYVTALEALTALGGILVGAIIFWRKRDDWMAMFVSIALITLGTFPTPLMTSVLDYQPSLSFLVTALQFIAIGPGFLIFYLFPDGHFTPPWTRWAALVWIIYSVAWLFMPALKPPLTLFGVQAMPGWLVTFFLVWIGIGVYAQVYRYRRHATSIERQQTKWVVFGFGLTLSILIWLGLVTTFFDYSRPNTQALLALMIAIAVVLFGLSITPVTVMLSILRFRLWDIDLLIRRTLQYSILSGLLALAYIGVIIALQSLIGERQNQLVTVLSTLAIATLFLPLRRRVQDFIDRRFYRKKYDAQKVLAEFAATCRDETDLERLTARLVEVVDETMQPERVTLWLKPTTDHGRQATVTHGQSSVIIQGERPPPSTRKE
jgi:hypothetical protein